MLSRKNWLSACTLALALAAPGVGAASPETLQAKVEVERGVLAALQLATNLRFTFEATRLSGGAADMRAYRIGNGEVAPFSVAFERKTGRLGVLLAGKSRTPRDAAAMLRAFRTQVLTQALRLTAAQLGIELSLADVHLRYIGPDGAPLVSP